jgi:hypothetical protein
MVRSARQTVAAVQQAHAAGLRITVRGGGHCYENFSSGNHGGVIVDLSGMQGVSRDRSGLVCVAGGAAVAGLTEPDFATLLGNYGRFLAANSSPSSPFTGLFSLLKLFHRSAGHITMTTQAAGPAFGLQRSSIMKLQYQTYWTSPGDDEVNLGWINGFYDSVYAASGGVPVSNRVSDGCFINYPDVDLPASWPVLYYKDGYPALQAVKARWGSARRVQPRPVDHPGGSVVAAWCSLVSAGWFSLSETMGVNGAGQAAAVRGLAGPSEAAKPCRQLG